MNKRPSSVAVATAKLRGLMQRAGHTSSSLAAAANISTSTVSRLVNSNSDTTKYSTLKKIAKALNVDIDQLTKTLSRKELKQIFKDDEIPF